MVKEAGSIREEAITATRMLDIETTINMAAAVVVITEAAVKRGAVRTIMEAKIAIHSKKTLASFTSIASWHLGMPGSSR